MWITSLYSHLVFKLHPLTNSLPCFIFMPFYIFSIFFFIYVPLKASVP